MPRGQAKLSINDLEQMLNRSRTQLNKLMRKRSRLQDQIDGLDRKIERLGGNGSAGVSGGRGRVRARNSVSLPDAIAKVLEGSGKPTPVGEIVNAVRASGYRSNSPNFRAIVNQALIKDKRFASSGRGLYQLKK
jgi:hypothetical protein